MLASVRLDFRLHERVLMIGAGQLLGAAAIFLLGIATARALGPAGRGAFSTVTFAAVLAGAAALSVTPAIAYFQPKSDHRPAEAGVLLGLTSGAVATGYLLAIGVSGAAAVVPVAYSCSVVPVAAVTGHVLAEGSGRQLGMLYALGPIAQAIAVAMALGLGVRDPVELVWIWMAGFGVVALGLSPLLRRQRPVDSLSVFLRYMVAAAGGNVLWALGARVELFVLAAIASSAEVGLYAVALAPAQALTVLASAYTSSVYGRLRAPLTESMRETRSAMKRLTIAQLVLALALGGLIPIALPAIYGTSFQDSVVPALIVVLAAFALAPASLLVAYFNNALGRPELGSAVAGAGLVAASVTTILLGGSLGANGAALGSLAGSVVGVTLALSLFHTTGRHAVGDELGDEEAQTGEHHYPRPSP